MGIEHLSLESFAGPIEVELLKCRTVWTKQIGT